jgi:hypothetical protein
VNYITNIREDDRKPFLVRVATLDDLRHLPPPRLVPADVRVEVSLTGLEDAQRGRFEQRLARQLSACGCREGSIALLLYLAGAAALAILGTLAPRSILAWVGMLGGMVAASLLGKIIGLMTARIRLRRVADDLVLAAGKGRTS